MDSLISLSNSLISRRGPQSRLCLSVDWAGLENPGSLSETKSKSVPCSFTSNWDHKVFSQSAAPDSTTWSLWVVLHSAVNWLCRVFSCSCKDLTISSLVCPISCLFWAVSSATQHCIHYGFSFPWPQFLLFLNCCNSVCYSTEIVSVVLIPSHPLWGRARIILFQLLSSRGVVKH